MTFKVLTNSCFRLTLALSIVGTILCCLPIFFRLEIDVTQYEYSIPLHTVLKSTSFEVCEAVSMTAAFPILFDFIMDSFVFHAEDINPAKLAIWILLLTSIIPNVATYFYVIPNVDINLLVLFPSCRTIPLLFSALWLLNTYGPSIWKWKLIMPIMLMHSITTVISSFKPFVSDIYRRNLDIIKLPFYILGGFIVLYMTLRWMHHIYMILRSSKTISPDDATCTWNLLALISFELSIIFFQYYLGDYLSADADPSVFTSRLYCITAFIITITSLNGRYE
eukprot:gene6299-12744_t